MSFRVAGLGIIMITSMSMMIASCEPIAERPLSNAPMNTCDHPCASYEGGTRVRASCTDRRCEIPGRPEFQFWIVVHVPDTSFFAPGVTFVLTSDVFTKTPDPSNRNRCTPPNCLLLPSLRNVTGVYTVTAAAAGAVGYPLPEGTSIPVRAAYDLVAPDAVIPDDQDIPGYPTLPLDKTFVSSSIIDRAGVATVRFSRVVPPGYYARVLFPQAPFDQYFPPVFFGSLTNREGNRAQLITGSEFIDGFELGGTKTPLDAVISRLAVVTREDGLDGFRVWLADRKTKRRISVIQPLSGKVANVHLFTSGENNLSGSGGGVRDDVEAIVAPPERYTAVPTYVTTIFGGDLGDPLRYPRIPPPVAVTGVIAEPGVEGESLLGYAATLSFNSTTITTKEGPNELLRYETYVATDDRGRFATVLPPGTYRVTIEPAVGTPFAKTSKIVVVEEIPTAFTLRPPLRTIVKGKVVLTDERPMNEAEVIAFPAEPTNPDNPKPRPNRTRTAPDGTYSFELDPGPYTVTVIPKAGTGFPWAVARAEVPAQATELPDIRVPAPTKLSFTLRDPGLTGNPIVRAVVRILAKPATASGGGAGAAKPVEIGSAMTDPNGLVEILLAQEPR